MLKRNRELADKTPPIGQAILPAVFDITVRNSLQPRYVVSSATSAGVAADLVRPRRKSGRTKSASGSGPDVAKSRGFSPGYVGLNFLL